MGPRNLGARYQSEMALSRAPDKTLTATSSFVHLKPNCAKCLCRMRQDRTQWCDPPCRRHTCRLGPQTCKMW